MTRKDIQSLCCLFIGLSIASLVVAMTWPLYCTCFIPFLSAFFRQVFWFITDNLSWYAPFAIVMFTCLLLFMSLEEPKDTTCGHCVGELPGYCPGTNPDGVTNFLVCECPKCVQYRNLLAFLLPAYTGMPGCIHCQNTHTLLIHWALTEVPGETEPATRASDHHKHGVCMTRDYCPGYDADDNSNFITCLCSDCTQYRIYLMYELTDTGHIQANVCRTCDDMCELRDYVARHQ